MRYHRRTPFAGDRKPRLSRLLAIAFVWLIGPAARAADPLARPPSQPVLQLMNGAALAGELKDSDQPGILRWQATPFVAPFDFLTNAVNTIHYPVPAKVPKPGGDYCFELAGADVLYGSLVDLNDKEAELDAPPFGRIHVQRANIHRIDRKGASAGLIYSGPNGLAGWHEPAAGNMWREELGNLVTEHERASIRGDFGIPAQAAIEFEISWKNKPGFVLALGVNDDEKTIERAFRFEVWDRDLVVLRDTDHEADLASVQTIAPGPGRAHLQVYLDQERERILVYSTGGKPLADLKVAGPRSKVLSGVHLANIRGDVRLERLRIGRWNGERPLEALGERSRIHCADGAIVYGQITRYNAASREFVVHGETGESRVPEDRIAGVFLSAPRDDRLRAVRAVGQDGAQQSGELIKVEKGELWLSVPGISEPLRLPVAALRALVVTRHEAVVFATDELTGVLEADAVRLHGRLADGRAQSGSSCLAWQPLGSATASPLRPGVSGRIDFGGRFREPARPLSRPQALPMREDALRRLLGDGPAPQAPAQPAAGAGAVSNAPARNQTQPRQRMAGRHTLYLRSGDIIPSEVTKIDEQGVWLRSALADSTFVPHAKVHAVELAQPAAGTISLTKAKGDRLLTVPRMQKESPPTHLIRSVTGDYLRGRVIAMDDKTLQVEVRLESKELPRKRISRIIWLEPDEAAASKNPAKPSAEDLATRVQAIRSDGIRLTFLADRLASATLFGKSEVLGPCQVHLNELDEILIGNAI